MKLQPVQHVDSLRFKPGDTTGDLTIIRVLGARHFKRGVAVKYECRCVCGNIIQRDRQTLIVKRHHHCGCGFKSHGTAPPGVSRQPLYKRWAAMLDRCENQSNKSYSDYGGRGISVCPRWKYGEDGLTGYESFLADMGPIPDPKLTLERQDSDGDYEPANCRWADRKTQSRNRRSLRLVTHGGRTQSVGAWAEETGIPYFTLSMRLRRGWDAERALTTEN